MVTAKPQKPATYEDLAALPEHLTGEIIDGELIVSPRPSFRHGTAAQSLYDEVSGPFRRGRGGPGGWVILIEPELHFGSQVVIPDLAGWKRERIPEMPESHFTTLAPDWVCEVLSPSTAKTDLTRKMPLYARERVGFFWLVDPLNRTLEVFTLDGTGWRLPGTFAGDDKCRAVPFDAIELELGLLWQL